MLSIVEQAAMNREEKGAMGKEGERLESKKRKGVGHPANALSSLRT
ncbi:MAG: hypothetical protein WAL87_00930 [Chthoniobacterales bacterium]